MMLMFARMMYMCMRGDTLILCYKSVGNVCVCVCVVPLVPHSFSGSVYVTLWLERCVHSLYASHTPPSSLLVYMRYYGKKH